MKYYVYAGYYENFISGHKLPKPYTLRDEFKTFDEALDYVWENWEDYLMEESKKSARKSIKESRGQTVAELLQYASPNTKVHIYTKITNDEFEGTVDELKSKHAGFLYDTIMIWSNLNHNNVVEIYCY